MEDEALGCASIEAREGGHSEVEAVVPLRLCTNLWHNGFLIVSAMWARDQRASPVQQLWLMICGRPEGVAWNLDYSQLCTGPSIPVINH